MLGKKLFSLKDKHAGIAPGGAVKKKKRTVRRAVAKIIKGDKK
jgi:hypothetical protein